MPNHVHLLLEMVEDPISEIMQALLTSYSRYHNRRTRGSATYCKRSGWGKESGGVVSGRKRADIGERRVFEDVKHQIGEVAGRRDRATSKHDLKAIFESGRGV